MNLIEKVFGTHSERELKPVSYTHLDVYKRQGQKSRRFL